MEDRLGISRLMPFGRSVRPIAKIHGRLKFGGEQTERMRFGLSNHEQQVNDIESAVRLAIRATRHRLHKLRERAEFLIGKLTGTTDLGIPTTSNRRISLL
jgi:hypothetical protein